MRAVSKRRCSQFLLGVGLFCVAATWAAEQTPVADGVCERPVYLTFDTGHMGVAPLVSELLAREKIRATFFLANEPTRTGGMTLDDTWAPWWKKMAGQGHAFASHTFDHVYWLADLPENQFKVRPSSGPDAGKIQSWSAQQYCDELARVDVRFEQMTGRKTLPLFRAAGGKTSTDLIQAAASCGYAHVGWSPAGFLGDELPSTQYPNALLLERALKNIRPGDILMAHLGIWSRQDPWAPAVLEPLVTGLKKKGFCFATIDQHPDYRDWVKKYQRTPIEEVAEDIISTEPEVGQDSDESQDLVATDTAEGEMQRQEASPVSAQQDLSAQGVPRPDAPRPDLPQPDTPHSSVSVEPDITLLDISTEKKAPNE